MRERPRDKSRANLACDRAGEYEGFFEKINNRSGSRISASGFQREIRRNRGWRSRFSDRLQCKPEYEISAACERGGV